jgi:L-ribulose-5-phosphate 4-epimerase
VWGGDAMEAMERAEVLEFLARMEIQGRILAPDAERPAAYLVNQHYFRKHGASAYYGQKR